MIETIVNPDGSISHKNTETGEEKTTITRKLDPTKTPLAQSEPVNVEVEDIKEQTETI